jgi:probable F420-dependent oxidoreductase
MLHFCYAHKSLRAGDVMVTPALGRYGAYLAAWRYNDFFPSGRVQVLEELGYGTVWIAGNPSGDLEIPESVLAQTKSVTVATAIVNVWAEPADKVAASFHRVEQQHPGRFLLGVGIGHREVIGDTYQRPYEMLSGYVDRLLQLDVPHDRIILAALRTKVLRLSADKTAGALPFFTTVEHTTKARDTLGQEPVLAVVQSCVPGTDLTSTRAIAREFARNPYLELQNYVKNLKETGFPDLQLGDEPSDALLDALVPSGGLRDTVARIQQHFSAGANHVPLLPLPLSEDPVPAFRLIGSELANDTAKR